MLPLVATLISDPARPSTTPALVQAAAAAAPSPARVETLAPGVAADLAFAGGSPREAEAAIRRAIGNAPVDVVVQPEEGRRKRLLLADMDSTMIEQECIDELADVVGLKGPVSAVTERAMRGELAFEPALRERVALLKGLASTVVERIVAERLTLTPGGPTLLATMGAAGAWRCLVSGGFTLFTGPVAAALGFDEHRANRLLVEDGALVGAVEEPILGREAKRATLLEIRVRLGLAPGEVLAVGDGANDLDMLAEAGLGVAFRAKPAVAEAAAARIDHGDLTALLYVQGYRREDFVEPGDPVRREA